MLGWLKKKKWLVLNALLVGVLVFSLGIQVIDRSSVIDRSVKIGVGNEKVITLGHVTYAAGSVDYTYDGTDDNVQFQAALNALPATGGRLVDVSAVQKNFSATVTRAIANVTITGTGYGSYFVNDGVTAIFTAGGNGWTFENLRTDAGGINMGATTGWAWFRVNDGSGVVYDIRTPAGSVVNGAVTASSLVAPTGRSATLVVAASNASATVKNQADYVCDGTADDVEIQAAIDALPGNKGLVKCIGVTWNTTAAIMLDNANQALRFESGSVVSYTGADAAFIIKTDYVELVFDQLISTGATADYGIKDQGARWARVTGNNIGGTEASNANRFKTAAYWFDAANSVIAGAGGSRIDIAFINHGQYGVKLDSAAAVTYEGCYIHIGVIMRSTVSQILLGSATANQTVRNNTIIADCDSQATSPLLIDVFNNSNNIQLKAWAAATGDYDVVFETEAANNHLYGGSSINILRYKDLARSNAVLIGTQGIRNEIPNASFELTDGTNPRGWTLSGAGASYSRSNTQVRDGSYSVALTRNGADTDLDGNGVDWNDAYRSKRFTAGMWIYATAASRAFFYVEDAVSTLAISAYHSGNAGWEWITVGGTLSATATRLRMHPKISGGDTTAYFDGAILVFGESVPPSSSPAQCVSRDNVNSGTATVANTTTSIVVNHGLATTPTDIQVTPAENPTNAVTYWWTDNLTATQFTINVDADPGASNLDFRWRAVVGAGN